MAKRKVDVSAIEGKKQIELSVATCFALSKCIGSSVYTVKPSKRKRG